MKPITVSTEVDRPAAEVFAFVSDVRNNPRWQAGMVSCEWTSPEPHGLDASYDQTARFLGRSIVSSFRIAEYEPGRRLTMTTTVSPFPITETRVVEPLGPHRSLVTATVGGDASKVFPLVAPVLRTMVGRSVRRDYARLSRLLGGATV